MHSGPSILVGFVPVLIGRIHLQGSLGTVDLPEVQVRIELKIEPGAGPALALAVLDPGQTGLQSAERLRIGLEQCSVRLTATELQLLVKPYLQTTVHGERVR